ncbi:MAG TPA: hypothetical protein VMT24_02710 [Aggregatilineaceae bacterium]|nr:hypothetical protein [Aggregatilineaceae bacterium]
MVYSPREDDGQILVSCMVMMLPLTLCSVLSLALLGPSIGNIFSNIVQNL